MATKTGNPTAPEEFPLHVLREYALIADGERGALVGPRGDIAWMCAPRWDSDAVFSALIGGGGRFAVTPHSRPFVWGGYYEEDTLIWRSRWITNSEVIESAEALAFPGDPHAIVVLRRIEAVKGDSGVDVVLDPRAGFGQHKMSRLSCQDGVWTARCGPLYLRFSGAAAATAEGGVLRLSVRVEQGHTHDLVLEVSDVALGKDPVDAEQAWQATRNRWERVIPRLPDTIADAEARHSYVVLQGLTSSGGGMVAGGTMSLPERSWQNRNYDYRYAWIRDQAYAGQAVAACGAFPLLDDAVSFVSARILQDGPDLKPAYTIAGEAVPGEQPLDLPGYPGGADKVGNWVNEQFQLDAFGEALNLFGAAAGRDRLDTGHWRAVEAAVSAIEQHRMDPDAGIWELEDKRWAHSRLSCVAGLRAVSAHAAASQAARWSSLADSILADTADCLHPSGRWQRAPDDPKVDAALLMPVLRGAVPPSDPRAGATFAAIMDELAQDRFMYRFRHDQRPLGEAEGAFLLCGFMTSLSLHQLGREVEANRWFERNRAACGPPGLFSEEYDTTQHQMRGNMPQAFVHALMLETAKRLAEPWAHQ